MNQRQSEIANQAQEILIKAFPNALAIEVYDESYKHLNHGDGFVENGGSHLKVYISDPTFEQMKTIAIHKAVYKALDSLMNNPIHALSIAHSSPSIKEQILMLVSKFYNDESNAQHTLSTQTISKICADAKMQTGVFLLVFPSGVEDLVEYFSVYVDEQHIQAIEHSELSNLKIREKIKLGLVKRLEIYDRHKGFVRKIAHFLLIHPIIAKAMLWKTSDLVWRHAAADESNDFNYYTKRSLLMGVWSSSFMFWLDDNSNNFQETKDFIARRIEEVMKLGKLLSDAKGFFKL